MLRIGLTALLLFVMVIPAEARFHLFSKKKEEFDPNCAVRTRFTWKLNLRTKEIRRIYNAHNPTPFCKSPPETNVTGFENSRFQIFDGGGQIIFERRLFVNVSASSEYHKQELTSFTVYLPWDDLKGKHAAKILLSDFHGHVVGEGPI